MTTPIDTPQPTPAVEAVIQQQPIVINGESSPLPAPVLLKGIVEGALTPPRPPEPLPTQERAKIYSSEDWTAVANMTRLNMIRNIPPDSPLRQQLEHAFFTRPEDIITFVENHPEIPSTVSADIADKMNALINPSGFDPIARRADFFSYAESQGAITGRMFADSTKALQEKLTTLQPILRDLQIANPAEFQKISGIFDSFSALANGGIVNPESLVNFAQHLPDLYNLDSGKITGFLARNQLSKSSAAIEALVNKINLHKGNLYDTLSDNTNPVNPQEVLSEFEKIIPLLDESQEALLDAEGKVNKGKLAAGIAAAAILMIALQGFGGISSTGPSAQ